MQVGLIGASNVGKSTLFNRLIGQFRAIVTDIHGTTQDILYHKTTLNDDLNDQSTELIFADSPGLLSFDEERPFIQRLLSESDFVFFVIDEKVGFTAKEQYIHEFIMNNGYKSKVVLLLNKVDRATNKDDEILITSEYAIHGYEDILIASAKEGKNISKIRQVVFQYAKDNDFLEKNIEEESFEQIYKTELNVDDDNNIISEEKIEEKEELEIEMGGKIKKDFSEENNDNLDIDNNDDEEFDNIEEEKKKDKKRIIETKKSKYFNIAIVGKPNSGKSTLLNTLAGKYISKVQDKPGTTLDYVVYDTEFEGEKFTIYDTAGIRRKGKSHGLEAIAYEKTINMLKYLHPPVLFLIDGNIGLTHRDMTLLKEIHQIGVSLVIGINKIDVLDTTAKKNIEDYIEDHLPFLNHVSILSLSAKTGKNVKKVLQAVKDAHKNSYTQIKTSKLNEVVHKSFISRPPRFPKNKICKILYMTQVSVNPCRFKIFINHKQRANFSFKRRLENVMRKNFGFEGNPLQLDFIERERRRLDKKFESGMR